MGFNRIVVNKNEIISENTFSSSYTGIKGKYTINMVSSGSVDYVLGKRHITLIPESFIFLNDTTSYSNKIDSAIEVNIFSVLFDPDFVKNFEYVNNRSDNAPFFVESIYPLQGDMKANLMHLKKHAESGTDDELLLTECLNYCLINYYNLYHSEVTSRAAALKFLNRTTKSEILKRLCIAKDYIISNYNKNLKLEDIAQVACLSVNHLLRTFKQAYQQSPHQFLTSVRLQQAKYYLKNTDYPVSEIVDIVGFECPSSFIRLFRNVFERTPGQYRAFV